MERCRLRAHFSVQYNIAGLTSACQALIAKLAIEGPCVFVLHWPQVLACLFLQALRIDPRAPPV